MFSCEDPCQHVVSDTLFCNGRHCLSLEYLNIRYSTTSHTLDLSHRGLEPIHGVYLGLLLKFFPHLTNLNISNNSFRSEGILAITHAIRHSTTLQSLLVKQSKLQKEGANAIAKLIRTNNHIKYLNISDNSLANGALKNICTAMEFNTSLLTLNISQIMCRKNHGIAAFSNMLRVNKTLSSLYLSNNNISSENIKSVMEGLMENETLTILDLSNNDIGYGKDGNISKMLSVNSTLRKLDLSKNCLKNEDAAEIMKSLTTNKGLESLLINYNCFSNVGIAGISEVLEHNTTLVELCINNCYLNSGISSFINSLSQNKGNLMVLSLESCWIEDETAQAIAVAMQTNSTITNLNLSKNSFSETSAPPISNMIKYNTTLEKLNLSHNSLSFGVASIIQALRYNNSIQSFIMINVTEYNRDDDNVAQYFDGEITKMFAVNNTLSYVDISKNNITESDMCEIAPVLTMNPNIMCLLTHTRFSDLYCEILFRNRHNKKKKETSLFQLLFRHLCEEPIHLISEKKSYLKKIK